ncbi:FAD-dependent monooxygenase [Propionivibrio dicarboxylicus]|uniref:2-octaprenyl-6-methoxyphenol hydroxylase n=1 Tax=Propionivibrio dicarboxylicus TaxID=83767 RepID=A0A1G8MEJ4_9RHOO|nr:FAD-dependent monooxygenase [Propionivibrio dicarboxylicus]SDI66247.1 2-octaprenyl-6-methoxyphenol hydroxylase [Propionivibrio dicarboxylicus]
MTEPLRHVDIAILGAGPVGMALARALKGSGLDLLLIDRAPRRAWANDPRALAIAHGSRQLLERLDAWNVGDTTDIRRIHVSQQGGFGRTELCAEEHGLPALGYVLRYRDLAARLERETDTIPTLRPATVERIDSDDTGVRLHVRTDDGPAEIAARLLVHAEGAPAEGPDVHVRDYGQLAIVTEVRPASSHNFRAWERFTPDGPLALLPFGPDYAIVLTAPTATAQRLLQGDEASFLDALRERLGKRIDIVACGPRAAFPLALRLRKQLAGPRQVWIGNTAQTLHPVTGQGFNLGLRDAWTLADTLWDARRQDPGDASTLARYARRRQPDRLIGTLLTDGLVRLFSNDIGPLRALRGLGLLTLDLTPPLRAPLARQMIWGTR